MFCLAGVLSAQELKLVPYPQSVTRGQGALAMAAPVRIALLTGAAEDRFAAGLLMDELKQVHRLDATVAAGSQGTIRIGRAGTPEIDAEITRRKLDRAALDRPEGYVLGVDATGALVAAKTAEGIFYGVQTLRQLIAAGGSVPAVNIADWPALRWRAFSLDINRGPILTEDQMRSLVRTLAEYKMNLLFFYMESVFRYTHSPLAAPAGGEITPELIQRLGAYARQYHIELSPHQQMFGHLHNMLKFELYAGMGEIPHGSVLSPASDRTYDWIRQAAEQLTAVFPSRFFHFGADETWELGEGQSRAMASRDGVAGVYLAHLERSLELLRPLGKEILFPGDIVLKHPEIIPRLPKELIALTWVYAPRQDYSDSIEPFRKIGMRYFVCSAVHNWNRPFPAFANTLVNVNNFTRDGKKMGAMGSVTSHWADDGEALFNTTWYGVVFSAAAAWQQGLVDTAAFDRAFDWAFYRNQDETFVSAIRRLYQTDEVMRAAGAGTVNDNMFWTDPFSRYGAEIMRKAYPAASKVRILAEQAAVDLAASRHKARLHADTIPFLELAARRLDYLGMKVQFTNEVGEIYRAMQADAADEVRTSNRLRRIRGMDGLLPSLRDYIHEVKANYREAWLAENRPYWLDNVLVRYDNEALYWVQKMQWFDAAAREYDSSGKLPVPESSGMFLP